MTEWICSNPSCAGALHRDRPAYEIWCNDCGSFVRSCSKLPKVITTVEGIVEISAERAQALAHHKDKSNGDHCRGRWLTPR